MKEKLKGLNNKQQHDGGSNSKPSSRASSPRKGSTDGGRDERSPRRGDRGDKNNYDKSPPVSPGRSRSSSNPSPFIPALGLGNSNSKAGKQSPTDRSPKTSSTPSTPTGAPSRQPRRGEIDLNSARIISPRVAASPYSSTAYYTTNTGPKGITYLEGLSDTARRSYDPSIPNASNKSDSRSVTYLPPVYTTRSGSNSQQNTGRKDGDNSGSNPNSLTHNTSPRHRGGHIMASLALQSPRNNNVKSPRSGPHEGATPNSAPVKFFPTPRSNDQSPTPRSGDFASQGTTLRMTPHYDVVEGLRSSRIGYDYTPTVTAVTTPTPQQGFVKKQPPPPLDPSIYDSSRAVAQRYKVGGSVEATPRSARTQYDSPTNNKDVYNDSKSDASTLARRIGSNNSSNSSSPKSGGSPVGILSLNGTSQQSRSQSPTPRSFGNHVGFAQPATAR